MLVFYMQFRDAIADLKTPERSDRYLLLWLKGREVVHCTMCLVEAWYDVFIPCKFFVIEISNHKFTKTQSFSGVVTPLDSCI